MPKFGGGVLGRLPRGSLGARTLWVTCGGDGVYRGRSQNGLPVTFSSLLGVPQESTSSRYTHSSMDIRRDGAGRVTVYGFKTQVARTGKPFVGPRDSGVGSRSHSNCTSVYICLFVHKGGFIIHPQWVAFGTKGGRLSTK